MLIKGANIGSATMPKRRNNGSKEINIRINLNLFFINIEIKNDIKKQYRIGKTKYISNIGTNILEKDSKKNETLQCLDI